MSSPTIITIAGLSGTLARLITKHLLQIPHVHINGLCRTPGKLAPFQKDNPRITIFKADATDTQAIRSALSNATICVCCYLGPSELMVDGQKALIDACIAENVPRYVASDWSMDFRNLEYGEHPAKDPMKHIAAYLEERQSEIKGVHILNACFIERPWMGIWDPKTQTLKYWGTGEEKWEFISYDDAAEFTARVALDQEAGGYKSFRGDHISIKGIAEEFKEVYGEEPKLLRLGSLEELYQTMHDLKAKNPRNIWSWLPMFYTYYSINGQTTLPQPIDNDKYPDVKAHTMRDYLRKTPKERLGRV